MDFWIIIDQRHAGPFSLEQLREQEITPDRLVWHDGLTDWTPACDIPALAELFVAKEPVAETPPCPPAEEPAPGQPPYGYETAEPRQPRPDPEFHYGAYRQPPYQQPYYGQPPYGEAPRYPQYAPGQQPQGQIPPCPPTYLVWAIITTVCCCTPLGIVAIIYAANIKNAYYRGDYMKAVRNSNRAQAWIIAAIVLGLIYIPIQMVYMGIFDMLSNI